MTFSEEDVGKGRDWGSECRKLDQIRGPGTIYLFPVIQKAFLLPNPTFTFEESARTHRSLNLDVSGLPVSSSDFSQ